MLDGALHSLGDGPIDAGARDHRDGARAAPRDDPRAARPLVRARAGRAPRPRLRGRRCGRSPTRPPSAHGIAFELDIEATRPRSATTASIALYTILRELIDQAIRRGPPSTSRSTLAPTDDGGARRHGRRRRRAGAPPPLARGDRGARPPAPRHARGRSPRTAAPRSASRSRRTPRGADAAESLDLEGANDATGTRTRGLPPLRLVTRRLRAARARRRPAAVGTELAGRRPRCSSVDEDRPLAAPGRHPPLRVHGRPLAARR